MTTNVVPNSRLGKVDMADDTNRSLVERFGIREFPAMKIFRHGVEVSYLSAALDATQIVDYLFTAKTKEVSIQLVVIFCRTLQQIDCGPTFLNGMERRPRIYGA